VKRLFALCLLALPAACGGGAANNSANEANVAAQEGTDLNIAIGGDELSPIPEAEDDMIANNSAAGNAAANRAAPAP
jgi:hypothetical protein